MSIAPAIGRAELPARAVAITVAGHFGAAFAALCMPPFYAQILQSSFSGPAPSAALAGWYFTLPTLAAAIANPAWGRLADRIGKRASLIRAHAGLCLSFLITGLARTPLEFAVGLTLQGVLGGTFAASNAFLAERLPAPRLAALLGVMQASARTALFAGPALIGILSGHTDLLNIFLYLALCPGLACVALYFLPDRLLPARGAAHAATIDLNHRPAAPSAAEADADAIAACGMRAASLYRLQALFAVGTVLSYPYFVTDLARRLEIGAATAGLLFGLPHALFLLLAWPLGRRLRASGARVSLGRYAALTCAGLLLQALAASLAAMVAGRIVMGLGMTGAYLAINTLAAASSHAARAGSHFGRLEGANKWGAVCAGLLASVLAPTLGYAAPLWLSAALVAAVFISLKWKLL
ncbi:MFS transporter [Duganella sp. FT50W]|uniref:MFS transporter n=1 Tax=Duganella lactea TaxID=2692173 RepID=A0A6L8ML22_9BURK|nr:MFS transporter [Duganella lactea]MYM82901.1 MFS transporter [Duganella lactea]